MEQSELLAAVCQRLADPAHWVQNSSARTIEGRPTNPSDPQATAWCLTGAIQRELSEHHHQFDHRITELFRNLSAEFDAQFPALRRDESWLLPIQLYNDHLAMTHAGLLAVLEKTLRTLQEHGE